MFENSVVFLPVEVVWQRDGIILPRAGGFIKHHDAVRVRIRQRPQQYGVDDTKDRSVRTDPERKRKNSDQSEPRRFAKLAKSKLEIVHVVTVIIQHEGQ